MCTAIGLKVRYAAGVEWRLWIGEKGLLRKAEKTVDGALHERLEYGVFDLSPKVPDETFVFTPAKGARCLRSGVDEEAALLPPGAEAPDFEALDPDGKPVRLSDFKGRPVLLHFWQFS